MAGIRVILQLYVSGMEAIAAMVDPHALPKWIGMSEGVPQFG
jgi:hypothetical protein